MDKSRQSPSHSLECELINALDFCSTITTWLSLRQLRGWVTILQCGISSFLLRPRGSPGQGLELEGQPRV